jgi:hypothetical protein
MLRPHRRCAVIAALLAVATTACGGGSSSSSASPDRAPSGGAGAGPIGDGGATSALSITGDFDGGSAVPGNVPVGSAQTISATGPDGAAMTCTVQQYDLTTEPSQFVSADPSSDTLWPGSIIQGASLPSGLLDPVPVPRAPGVITLTLASGSGSQFSRTLPDPSLGTATQAINDILTGYAGTSGGTPAKFSYQSESIYSSSQLAIEAGVNASGTGWSGSASLSFDSSETENRYLLQFTQAYFTMAFDPPAGPASVFAPSVTQADLAPYTGPGNPLLYVSSVTYGRIFYLLFQSTSSSTNLAAAIQAAYQGGVNVDGGVSTTYEQVLENTSIEAYGLGGDAAVAISAVTQAANAKFGALSSFLTTGADFDPQNPGVPISYTVRNLADSTEVGLVFNTQYTAKDCSPVVGTSENLLQNPGADTGDLWPWIVSKGNAYVIQYCAPDAADFCGTTAGQTLPPNPGSDYFGGYQGQDSGSPAAQTSGEISQTIDLSTYGSVIQSGNATFNFGGWLGGWGGHDDNATVTVQFTTASGNGETPVNNTLTTLYTTSSSWYPSTEFVCEAIDNGGTIPTDATSVTVAVDFWYEYPKSFTNDASADDLWFQITGPGISGTTLPITCGDGQ